jgi:hypothetical protein
VSIADVVQIAALERGAKIGIGLAEEVMTGSSYGGQAHFGVGGSYYQNGAGSVQGSGVGWDAGAGYNYGARVTDGPSGLIQLGRR